MTLLDTVNTLSCISLSKRLRENCSGGKRKSRGGIHTTSYGELCNFEYITPPDFLREDVTLLNYKGEDWSKYEAAILVEQVRG